MKPYLREKKIKGLTWKRNYHVHLNNKKIGNWWEDMDTFISRSTVKLRIKKEIF